MSPPELRVIAAAIRYKGVVIMAPQPYSSHNTAINFLHYEVGREERYEGEEGFVLSDGTFATRTEAMPIAKAAGQFRVHDGPDAYYSGEHYGINLFSEDLWSHVSNKGRLRR